MIFEQSNEIGGKIWELYLKTNPSEADKENFIRQMNRFRSHTIKEVRQRLIGEFEIMERSAADYWSHHKK